MLMVLNLDRKLDETLESKLQCVLEQVYDYLTQTLLITENI